MLRVIIERHLKPGAEPVFLQALQQARSSATEKPGWLSGEILKDTHNPNHWLVISNWKSRKDWDTWLKSEERRVLSKATEALLEKPEKITFYEPL